MPVPVSIQMENNIMTTLIIAHSFHDNKINKLDKGSQETVAIDALYEKVIHEYPKYNPVTKKHEKVVEEVQYVRTVSGERYAARKDGNNYITVPMY